MSIVKGNKKTPEQIKEDAKLRKQKQREQLRERYGDEEYKKMRAKEIADQRKNRDENIVVKRTPEQIKETNRIRKQKQREREHTPLNNSIHTADELSTKLPVTDLNIAPPLSADSNLHQFKIIENSTTQEPILENTLKIKEEEPVNIIDEIKNDKIKEQNRIRKQKQREREQSNIIVDENNKTPDEIREQNRIRKQKQREKQREKYGNEEYNKINAEKIAEYRKKKIEENQTI